MHIAVGMSFRCPGQGVARLEEHHGCAFRVARLVLCAGCPYQMYPGLSAWGRQLHMPAVSLTSVLCTPSALQLQQWGHGGQTSPRTVSGIR